MYSLIANHSIRDWISINLEKYKVNSKTPYVENEYIGKGFRITLYENNTLLIDGEIKDRIYDKFIDVSDEQDFFGYDEVGVGDFFGPVVYCNVAFTSKTIDILKTHKISIKDSKKYKDIDILNIYEKIRDKIDYVYEKIYDNEVKNLNSIEQKVYYHNMNYEESIDIHTEISKDIIDLFTTIKSFEDTSKRLELSWSNNIVLETKADSKYNCVGLASMMARAIYLEEMDELNKKYDMQFPLGTNEKVVAVAKDFVDKYSKEELAMICKTSFKTFDEI